MEAIAKQKGLANVVDSNLVFDIDKLASNMIKIQK